MVALEGGGGSKITTNGRPTDYFFRAVHTTTSGISRWHCHGEDRSSADARHKIGKHKFKWRSKVPLSPDSPLSLRCTPNSAPMHLVRRLPGRVPVASLSSTSPFASCVQRRHLNVSVKAAGAWRQVVWLRTRVPLWAAVCGVSAGVFRGVGSGVGCAGSVWVGLGAGAAVLSCAVHGRVSVPFAALCSLRCGAGEATVCRPPLPALCAFPPSVFRLFEWIFTVFGGGSVESVCVCVC